MIAAIVVLIMWAGLVTGLVAAGAYDTWRNLQAEIEGPGDPS